MKINVVLIGLLFFGLSVAFAKEIQSLSDVLNKMKKELQLTDEQVEAIKPIIKENLAKRQKLFDSISGDPVINKSQFKIEMMKLKEEENEKLSKVLSKEQMKKLIDRQHIKESLNKDQIDFSEGLSSGVSLSPEGGSLQF